jgi:hypothetical protein
MTALRVLVVFHQTSPLKHAENVAKSALGPAVRGLRIARDVVKMVTAFDLNRVVAGVVSEIEPMRKRMTFVAKNQFSKTNRLLTMMFHFQNWRIWKRNPIKTTSSLKTENSSWMNRANA